MSLMCQKEIVTFILSIPDVILKYLIPHSYDFDCKLEFPLRTFPSFIMPL